MKTFYKVFLCLAFSLLTFSCIAEAKTDQAKVIEVNSCYSLKVLVEGEAKIVRIAEVVCPHTHLSPLTYEKEAKQFLRQITSGKDVTLLFWAIDSIGRSVCEVFLPDGTSLGELMVSNGYSLQDQYYSERLRLRSLEEKAKKGKLGIWKNVAIVNL